MDAATPAETKRADPIMEAVLDVCRPRRSAICYPFYLASRVKRALLEIDASLSDGQIIDAVADIETIGDGRYAMRVTDHLNNLYRVTVEVLRDAPAEADDDVQYGEVNTDGN